MISLYSKKLTQINPKYALISNISTMASEGKKVRAELKKAFNAKDIEKIERIGKRKKLTKMISITSIAEYLDKSIKDDDRKLHNAMLDEICPEYDFMDLFFSIIDINSVKLVEELLMEISSNNDYHVLFHYALDHGRLSIAELIHPYTIDERYYDIKCYSKFKKFVDNNWFTVDEDDMSEDGFIIAVISNRNDLVKKY